MYCSPQNAPHSTISVPYQGLKLSTYFLIRLFMEGLLYYDLNEGIIHEPNFPHNTI